jgi:hypothetical protein
MYYLFNLFFKNVKAYINNIIFYYYYNIFKILISANIHNEAQSQNSCGRYLSISNP